MIIGHPLRTKPHAEQGDLLGSLAKGQPDESRLTRLREQMNTIKSSDTGHASRRARAMRNHPTSKPATHLVSVAKADPMAWEHALKIAKGDTKRLVPQADGSVIIHNNPVR
jgi:hypothetical protein